MRIHFIDRATNLVVNTVEQSTISCPFPDQFAVGAIGNSDIGDRWTGSSFVKPPAPPTPVPDSIAMWQARVALSRAGKLALIQPAIDALPEPAKTEANIQWEYSNTVQRHNGFVSQLAPALGLTDAQIDALFIAGAAL
jgi:hypothetical protein